MSILGAEDDGFRGAGDDIALAVVLDLAAVQDIELDVIAGDPCSAGE